VTIVITKKQDRQKTQMILEVYSQMPYSFQYIKVGYALCMDRKLLYYKTQIQIGFSEFTQHVLL